MISGKGTEYKLLRIENEKGLRGVGTFLANKWVDKVIDISRVSEIVVITGNFNDHIGNNPENYED